MTLRYFDSHVREHGLSTDLLADLRYFHVEKMLLVAHSPEPLETSEDCLAYFDDLRHRAKNRLAELGIDACIALGLNAATRPRRTHPEVWDMLPSLLESDPSVVAVGELVVETGERGELDLLARQLDLAHIAGVVAMISVHTAERARRARDVVATIKQSRLDPSRVLISHLDYTSLRAALELGCWCGLTVGPLFMSPQDASELIARYGLSSQERVVLNSGLQAGVNDVLALPKTALCLADAGFDREAVQRLTWDNPLACFRSGGP